MNQKFTSQSKCAMYRSTCHVIIKEPTILHKITLSGHVWWANEHNNAYNWYYLLIISTKLSKCWRVTKTNEWLNCILMKTAQRKLANYLHKAFNSKQKKVILEHSRKRSHEARISEDNDHLTLSRRNAAVNSTNIFQLFHYLFLWKSA